MRVDVWAGGEEKTAKSVRQLPANLGKLFLHFIFLTPPNAHFHLILFQFTQSLINQQSMQSRNQSIQLHAAFSSFGTT